MVKSICFRIIDKYYTRELPEFEGNPRRCISELFKSVISLRIGLASNETAARTLCIVTQ